MKSPVQASGYSESGGSTRRRALKSFVPNSSSPNEDINWNNFTLRQRGRMLYMGAPIATSAVNTNRTKVVGAGLTMKPNIPYQRLGMTPEQAKDWSRRTEEEWNLWAKKKQHCDAIGSNNFAGLQQLAVVSWLTSGDVFAVFQREEETRFCPYTLRLRMVEADRIATPSIYAPFAGGIMTDGTNPDNHNTIYDGVEVDKRGKIVAYHICSHYPRTYYVNHEPVEWTRVEAYGAETGLPNVLHLMNSERPDQYRGVTYLAQAMEPILQQRRYTDSTLMAALVQTYFSAWITTSTDTTEMPFNEAGDVIPPGGGRAEEADGEGTEYRMGPGTVSHLAEGDDIKFGNPNIPTANFDDFMGAIAKLCGASLEIPQEILLKEFQSSYSAARAALLEAWEGFKIRRNWLVDDFCQPTYEMWLTEAVARGRISAPGFFDDPILHDAWCSARWIGPVQGQLDPLKEVNAAIKQVQEGFKSREQITLEMGGGDWNDNVVKKVAEEQALAKANAAKRQNGGGTT